MHKGYMTTDEAAVQLGFSTDHVRRLINQGKIKAERLGHSWLIKPKDLKGITRKRWPKGALQDGAS